MHHLARLLVLSLLAGLVAAAPVAASTMATGSTTTAVASTSGGTALSSARVVIVVGPVQSETAKYIADGESAYATAIQYSSNVVRLYSPNATWAAVKAAITGASVVIYIGHGNGWPSPYTYDPKFTTKDGFGLNITAGAGDGSNNMKYYGEPYFANEIRLAPNAVVLLNHLCYASGNSEPGNPDPTLSVAMQRADNFGQGFIMAGAGAVIAEGHGSVNGMIRDLFTAHESVDDLWRSQSDYHHNEFSFQSMRNPAYTDFMDPDLPSGGYYRSLVVRPGLRTEDVTGVTFQPTDTTPATLVSPGAASVATGGSTLYSDSSLSTTSSQGSLPAGTKVRVDQLTGGTTATPAAYIRSLDGPASGWAAATTLAPQDSLGPELWSAVGTRTISPNGDGLADTMSFEVAFSEAVAWSATVRDAGGHSVWNATGSGRLADLAWNAKVGTSIAPDGPYTLTIGAHDSWGNPALSSTIFLTVDASVMPTRLSGADRYETAAAISAAIYAPGVPVAYVASGLDFPDALAGAPAAGTAGGPLLTVPGTSIPPAIAAELTRLKPARIVVLGGSSVVSDSVATQLASYTTGTVTRLAGPDRYATAAAISKATYAPGVPVVYIATGLGFADALAGAPAAGTAGGPLLLVPTSSIPPAIAAELTRLKPARIVVLGGSSAVSQDSLLALKVYTAF